MIRCAGLRPLGRQQEQALGCCWRLLSTLEACPDSTAVSLQAPLSFGPQAKEGGRYGSEAAKFVRMLARSRARAAPLSLQAATTATYVSRWSALPAFAAARATAASFLGLHMPRAANIDGLAPSLSEVLSDDRYVTPLRL